MISIAYQLLFKSNSSKHTKKQHNSHYCGGSGDGGDDDYGCGTGGDDHDDNNDNDADAESGNDIDNFILDD